MHCFEVRGIVRFALHHSEHRRDHVSQVGIWRKLTFKVVFFLIVLGSLSHAQQMENVPGHLKMILGHVDCHVKLGKEICGRNMEA